MSNHEPDQPVGDAQEPAKGVSAPKEPSDIEREVSEVASRLFGDKDIQMQAVSDPAILAAVVNHIPISLRNLNPDGSPSVTVNVPIHKWGDMPLYDGPVCHYTSYGAALEIIRGASFHAGRVTHLNDAHETVLGAKKVREAVVRLPEEFQGVAEAVLDAVERSFRELHLYVLCASKTPNDLNQLRLYGEVCLEWHSSDDFTCVKTREYPLQSVIRESMDGGWREMIYDDAMQDTLALRLVRAMVAVASANGITPQHLPTGHEFFVLSLAQWYATFVSVCKSAAFRGEDEVRFTVLLDKDWQSREAVEHKAHHLLGIVPYITLGHASEEWQNTVAALLAEDEDGDIPPTPVLPLRAVHVLGKPHVALSRESVLSLLDATQYPEIPVNIIETGYRS